jgi:uncharacterized protein (UPF0276 family)
VVLAVADPVVAVQVDAVQVDAEAAVGNKFSFATLPMLGVGIGYRQPFRNQLFLQRTAIDFLELVADHFFSISLSSQDELACLQRNFPTIPHGLALSLGSADGLDPVYTKHFVQLLNSLQPAWCSDHIAFTRANGIDIGHLTPLPKTRASLRVLRHNITAFQDQSPIPLLLENITEPFRYHDDQYGDADFLCEICEQNNVGILMDVTNLFINSQNYRFDPITFLHRLPRERLVQLHFVGARYTEGQWHDAHSTPTQEEIWQLLTEVVKYGSVKGIILERDLNIPDLSELVPELQRARTILEEFG